MAGCLDGIRVLELARYQAGPRCGMILSDLGAEVIKIEKLGGEDTRNHVPKANGHSLYFSVYNRGKKSLCLDMRSDEGKEIFNDLLKTADFVLENFKPGTMEKMGLGYETLCKTKPDIILLSASGFGQYGPYRDRPGFDGIGQAMSGLMTLTGVPVGQPVATASSIIDRITSLNLTAGALAALEHRDRTGEGQVVDVCLLDSALTLTELPIIDYLRTGESGPRPSELKRPPYQAKDGWVIISVGGGPTKMNQAFRELIEHTSNDQSNASPVEEANAGTAEYLTPKEIAAWCCDRTVADICESLTSRGIVAAPVYTIPEVAKDPHLWAREMLVKVNDAEMGDTYLPGLSIKFSKTPGKTGLVHKPGQDTDPILKGLLGYDTEHIENLHAEEII